MPFVHFVLTLKDFMLIGQTFFRQYSILCPIIFHAFVHFHKISNFCRVYLSHYFTKGSLILLFWAMCNYNKVDLFI